MEHESTPSLRINIKSGTVHWGQIQCGPDLKIDDFQKRYANVHMSWRDDGRGMWRTEIQLPRLPVSKEFWNAKIAYENQFLRRIEFTAGGLTRDIPEKRWWYFHMRWMVAVKAWLLSNIGRPIISEPTSIYEGERNFSQLEEKVLETWQYPFDWGTLTFAYESLENRSSVTLLYDSSNQIRDWNDLLLICHWAIQRSHAEGTSTTNLSLIRDTISVIGKHFKFEAMNPKVSRHGLIFWSPELTTYIDMEIWRNPQGKNYRLYRRDNAQEIRVPSEYELLDAMRKIFELG